MFGKRIDLFKLFGFETRIDLNWAVLAILLVWSLSAGLFPFRYEGLSNKNYWIIGIVGAIGLFYPSLFTKWPLQILWRKQMQTYRYDGGQPETEL